MAILIHSAAHTGAQVDLRQVMARRLATLTLEKRRLQSRLTIVEELEKELRTLLEGAEQPSFPSIAERPIRVSDLVDEGRQGTAIKLFLQEQLTEGPKSLEQIVVAARDRPFEFGEKSVARTLHFHLLNLKNSGLIEKQGELWTLVERPPQ